MATNSAEASLEQIAMEIAKGLVFTGVEGPFNTFESSSAGDYPTMGCSCWEGSRGDRLLRELGLGKYAGMSYSSLCEKDKTGKSPKDEIVAVLGSEKGKQVQLSILSSDTKDYVKAIKSAVPNISNVRCIVYAGIWCPTSTYCVQRHLQKNVGAINDLAALNGAFINDPGSYALSTANVGSQYAEGYRNRGNITYNYCLGIKNSDIGNINLADLQSVQGSFSAEGSLSAGSSSAATASVKLKDTPRHGKHLDFTFASPEKLYCEPIYPDLVCANNEVPGQVVKEVMKAANESEVTITANMLYSLPQETVAKYADRGYAESIISNEFVSAQKAQSFDIKSFATMSKAPNGGKPPNHNDPFPIDEKIQEMEMHVPRCKIEEIRTCPEAVNVTKACIKLSMDVERRLVHLENNVATILRYLSRFAARVPINCVYYGGQNIYDTHKCIRCMKDNRTEDGQLMTFDQCLCCTRYEPIIGQVYEILNDEGLNLSEVLDECQMSYTTPEEYIKFASPTVRQDKLDKAVLGASSIGSRKADDAAEDFASVWPADSGFTMDWNLVPVEDQVPSVNTHTSSLSSNMNSFANSGTPMAGMQNVENILTRQKKLMDVLGEDDFGYTAVQEAKEWVDSAGEGFVSNMNEYLYKNITDALARKKSSMDALLVSAITCASGKSAAVVIDELEGAQKSLNSKNVTSLLLIAQFHNMDQENLFGDSGKADDKTLRMRLDKVYKLEALEDADNNISEPRKIQFGLDWDKVNEWNWTEYAEPLNINVTKEFEDPALDESMKLLPKIIYLYCLFRAKCNSSKYDDLVHGYVFPFRESDVSRVRLSADYYDQRSYGYHCGLDLATDSGVDILAITDGVVYYTESGGGAGNAIVLKHNDGLYSIYCHMRALEHKEGESISKGQIIGHVGHTGHCYPEGEDGSHLHFQINSALQGSFRNNALDPIAGFFTRLVGKTGQFL